MKNNLLPCPFCGGKAKLVIGSEMLGHGMGAKSAKVVCQKCGNCTKTEIEWDSDPVNVVVSLWNTRLTQRAADGFADLPVSINAIADNTGSPRRGVYRRR